MLEMNPMRIDQDSLCCQRKAPNAESPETRQPLISLEEPASFRHPDASRTCISR